MKDKLKDLALKPREKDSWAGEAVEELEQDRASRLIEEGLKKIGYGKSEELKEVERYVFARWIRSETRVGIKWLAYALNVRSPGTMSYGLWYAKGLLNENSKAKKMWKKLIS